MTHIRPRDMNTISTAPYVASSIHSKVYPLPNWIFPETLALPTLAMKLAKQRLNSKLTSLEDEASQKGTSKLSDAAQRSLLKLLSEMPTESRCHG